MGVKERKEREREQRRSDILVSARLAFVAHGLENTSMDRIANEAELAKGTLYLYFKNRNELLMALLAEDFERLLERMSSAVEKVPNTQDKFIAAVETFHDYSVENEFFYGAMTQLNVNQLFGEDCQRESYCHLQTVNQSMLAFMISIVQEGIDKRVFFVEQSVPYVVMQILLALKGAMVVLRNQMLPPQLPTADPGVVMKDIARLMIRGLENPIASHSNRK